jgi:hypothetical protein
MGPTFKKVNSDNIFFKVKLVVFVMAVKSQNKNKARKEIVPVSTKRTCRETLFFSLYNKNKITFNIYKSELQVERTEPKAVPILSKMSTTWVQVHPHRVRLFELCHVYLLGLGAVNSNLFCYYK